MLVVPIGTVAEFFILQYCLIFASYLFCWLIMMSRPLLRPTPLVSAFGCCYGQGGVGQGVLVDADAFYAALAGVEYGTFTMVLVMS